MKKTLLLVMKVLTVIKLICVFVPFHYNKTITLTNTINIIYNKYFNLDDYLIPEY
jgi:hypothetical protein